MFGFSPPPTGTCPRRSVPAHSERISSTDWMSCPSSCPPFASARKTSGVRCAFSAGCKDAISAKPGRTFFAGGSRQAVAPALAWQRARTGPHGGAFGALGRNAEIGVGDLPDIPVFRVDRQILNSRGNAAIRELQCRYAAWALAQVGGHPGKAAEQLGIDAKTLWKWLGPHDDGQREDPR